MRVLAGMLQGEQLLEGFADILNGRVRKDFLGQTTGLPADAPKEIKTQAGLEFLTTLRQLVDQWLATGREYGQDGDDPWERSVWLTTSDHPRPISDALGEYFRRNPLMPFISGDSRIDKVFEPLPGLSVLDRARDRAIYLFIQLLNSPVRECLSHCDECSEYFACERMPKRGAPIRHGRFCVNCKNAGAARRVEDRRSQRTAEMVGWAADARLRWESAQRGSVEDAIIRKVNARIGRNGKLITGNWVTRHTTEIEAEAERRRENA